MLADVVHAANAQRDQNVPLGGAQLLKVGVIHERAADTPPEAAALARAHCLASLFSLPTPQLPPGWHLFDRRPDPAHVILGER
jgi:hypothetical protein